MITDSGVSAKAAIVALAFLAVNARADVMANTPAEAPAMEDGMGGEDPMAAGGAPGADKAPVDAELATLNPPYSAAKDVEYTPLSAPETGTPVVDLEGITTATATECAQACIDSAECNFATWMGANPEWEIEENCWLKTIGQPCEVPAEATDYAGSYLLIEQTPGCEPVASLPPNAGAAPAPATPVLPVAGAAGPTASDPFFTGGNAIAPSTGFAPGAPIGAPSPLDPIAPESVAPLPGGVAGNTGTDRNLAPDAGADPDGSVGLALGSAAVIVGAALLL